MIVVSAAMAVVGPVQMTNTKSNVAPFFVFSLLEARAHAGIAWRVASFPEPAQATTWYARDAMDF